ncbi:MAG: hypothetical protein K0Q79_1526 [Flavipsychrobacter sp.]|jgi:hypothetical protein|nr:hypothetical protein [Flavipsychrobacter sp.]
MKSKLMCTAVLCALVLSCIISCRKTPANTSTTTTINNTDQLFADLKTSPQNFTVKAGIHKTIFGAEGTIISFYPNTFRDKNGNTVTSGTVNIQLTEMYKPGSMIANKASTMSGGQVLKSGGQVYIKATVNGQEVYANNYMIGFPQSAVSGETMQLFHNANEDNNVIQWELQDTAQKDTAMGNIAFGALRPDTLRTGDTVFAWLGSPFFRFDSNSKFGWTNCDRFYYATTRTGLKVKLPDNSFNPDNTEIFLVLPSLNAVMSSDKTYLGTVQYDKTINTMRLVSEGQNDNLVPVGLAYKVVVMATKDNKNYYFESSGTTVTNLSVDASSIHIETLSSIQEKLKNL